MPAIKEELIGRDDLTIRFGSAQLRPEDIDIADILARAFVAVELEEQSLNECPAIDLAS